MPSPPPDPTVTASPTDPTATRTAAAAAAAAAGGLSTNTKTIVGIAIALGLLVLVGAGIGAWIYFRRRRRQTQAGGGGLIRERSSSPIKPISPGDGDGEANWVPQINRADGGYGTEIRAYSSLAHDQQSESMPSVEYHYGMRRDVVGVRGGGGYGTGGLSEDGEEDEGGLPGYGKSRALDGGGARNGGARGMYQRYEAMGDEKMLIPDRGDEDVGEGGVRGGGGGVV